MPDNIILVLGEEEYGVKTKSCEVCGDKGSIGDNQFIPNASTERLYLCQNCGGICENCLTNGYIGEVVKNAGENSIELQNNSEYVELVKTNNSIYCKECK